MTFPTEYCKAQQKLGYRMIAAAAVMHARFSQMVLRVILKLGYLLTGVLDVAFDTKEKEALTMRLYDAATEKYAVNGGLFNWEALWYDQALPPAPARILVTAAGCGREVLALLERGYSVDAAEPVAKFAAECAGLPGIGDFFEADNEAIAHAITTGNGPAAALRGRVYDAVIIGWGSFAHMIDAGQRQRFLSACHVIAPQGPILLSFFSHIIPPMPNSRFIRFGRAFGRCIARVRGVTSASDPNDIFLWHAGFFHRFSEEEIGALADQLGRRAVFAAEPYGHATLFSSEQIPPSNQQFEAAVFRRLVDLFNSR